MSLKRQSVGVCPDLNLDLINWKVPVPGGSGHSSSLVRRPGTITMVTEVASPSWISFYMRMSSGIGPARGNQPSKSTTKQVKTNPRRSSCSVQSPCHASIHTSARYLFPIPVPVSSSISLNQKDNTIIIPLHRHLRRTAHRVRPIASRARNVGPARGVPERNVLLHALVQARLVLGREARAGARDALFVAVLGDVLG